MRFAIAFVSLPVIGALLLVPAPARAADDAWVVCAANGSVALYTDESKTQLVDAFRVIDAPTRHRIGSQDFVIQGSQSGPGVDVTGVVTGDPYVFEFRSVSAAMARTPGGTVADVTWFDWRVIAPRDGVISDSRTQWIGVYVDGDPIVVDRHGPVIHGLMLSGGLSITCPEF